jgi:GNAT superfamily N-acetyltransferase
VSTGASIAIRSAAPKDAARIAELLVQLGYTEAPEDLAARLRRGGNRRDVLIAVVDEQIVGWAAVCTDEPFVEGWCAVLEGLVVEDSMRNRGVGAQLLEAAEAWARERGCAHMLVRSNVVRERAHAFYRCHGYATIKAQYQLRKPL